MIKEVVEKKINQNIEKIIEEVILYCGESHRSKIEEKAKNIKLSIIKDEGVYCYEGGEVYVGEEPLCIKEDGKSHIVIPLSVMGDDRGNVSFVHVLLHALSDDVFIKDDKDAFNELIVDYMANEIAKGLKAKEINITLCRNPIYESNSFYSKMFNKIESFYFENKEKIINSKMKKNELIENIDQYIDCFQGEVDKIFERNINELDIEMKRIK